MSNDKKNKTFALSQQAVGLLESVQAKSAFVEELIIGNGQGRFISQETAGVMKEYQNIFGADPEQVIQTYLAKRVSKIKMNLQSLKESPREEVKNKVGGAFLKLNQAFHDLISENETLKDKRAITFGLLFKKTGCNHGSIRNWLRANKDALAEYHNSLGISDPASHNRHLGVLKRIATFEEKTILKQKEVQKELARIKRENAKKEKIGGQKQNETGANQKKGKNKADTKPKSVKKTTAGKGKKK
jgi:hypothetical protein